jgi:hypothetical protein
MAVTVNFECKSTVTFTVTKLYNGKRDSKNRLRKITVLSQVSVKCPVEGLLSFTGFRAESLPRKTPVAGN